MTRITQIETLCLSRMHEPERQWFTHRYRVIKADCAIVVISTDAGVTGIGEACAYGVPSLIRAWVAWLAPGLIGRDPHDPALAPHPNGRTYAFDCAAGGIDCALWDLRGKLAGRRVCDLLTDRAPDKVRLYASGGCRYDWRNNPSTLIDEVTGLHRRRIHRLQGADRHRLELGRRDGRPFPGADARARTDNSWANRANGRRQPAAHVRPGARGRAGARPAWLCLVRGADSIPTPGLL